MTQQHPPGPEQGTPWHQQPQPWPQQPPPKRKSPTWLIVLAVGLVGLFCVGGIAVVATSGGADGPTPTSPQREAPAESAAPAGDQPDPEPAYQQPAKGDLDLSIKVTSKECFGSAGCNIEFRVELAYSGPDLDPAVTYEVTYEIKGGDDPYINTLTVTGDQYSTDEWEFIGTPSSDAQLRAVVMEVSEY